MAHSSSGESSILVIPHHGLQPEGTVWLTKPHSLPHKFAMFPLFSNWHNRRGRAARSRQGVSGLMPAHEIKLSGLQPEDEPVVGVLALRGGNGMPDTLRHVDFELVSRAGGIEGGFG